MFLTSIVIPVLTLVVIFLFGIQKFSKQIDQVAGEKFKSFLSRITKTPLRGTALGLVFTSLIQSSTATTVILVGLVNAEIISFSNSLGVIFGANIGTTVTSQLVALNVANIAPYFILAGFLITYLGRSYNRWGKPIFYFGLIFFSLSLISLYIEPVKSDPSIIKMFASITNIYTALAVGIVFTAIIQSSSVASGLVVLLVGAGLLNFEQAIGVVLGANIGTTATALLASIKLSLNAKRVAIAHFLFNVLGVLIFLPFLQPFSHFVASFGGSEQQVIANAHLLFNVACAAVFLLCVKPFEFFITSLIPAEVSSKPL
jgi:phosphate:Na+ symporter